MKMFKPDETFIPYKMRDSITGDVTIPSFFLPVSKRERTVIIRFSTGFKYPYNLLHAQMDEYTLLSHYGNYHCRNGVFKTIKSPTAKQRRGYRTLHLHQLGQYAAIYEGLPLAEPSKFTYRILLHTAMPTAISCYSLVTSSHKLRVSDPAKFLRPNFYRDLRRSEIKWDGGTISQPCLRYSYPQDWSGDLCCNLPPEGSVFCMGGSYE